jgi:hypothetical protein
MKSRISLVSCTLTAVLIAAPGAGAQSVTPLARQLSEPPTSRLEVGLSIGAWNLNDGGAVWAGRLGRRVTSWLSSELTLDAGRPDALSTKYRMAVVALKISVPASRQSDSQSVFVTVGAAAATGLSYRRSFVAGVGWQSAWAARRLATRVEIQSFARGSSLADKGRVLVGLVVALP